jgi:LysM repeat protein
LASQVLPRKTKPMNDEPSLSTNLLQADARVRKQIPIAVFAVIAIHVVLFLSLLASGCKRKATGSDAAKFKTSEYNKALPSSATTTTTASEQRPTAKEQLPTESITEVPAPLGTPAKPAAPLKNGKAKKGSDLVAETATGTDGKVHVVKQGESLFKIAKLYNTTPKSLKASNNLKGDVIRVGQKLRIG